MNKLYLVLLVFLSACGSIKLTEDPVLLSDSQAFYESVMTKVGNTYRYGPTVYLITDVNQTLEIFTVLDGSYEIRSDSCNYTKQGAYSDSSPIKIPISEIRDQLDETLCVMTIQISPQIRNTQVPIYPAYSIAYFVFTSREAVGSGAFQFTQGFNFGKIFSIEDKIARYRVIRKCTYEETPVVISESVNPVEKVEITADGITSKIGSCYFAMVYIDGNGVAKRAAYVTNVYDERHFPLFADIVHNGTKIEVTPSAENAICLINGVIQPAKRCKRKALAQNIIGVFTNKRSYWVVKD